jgi:RNA polymerase sigma-70 factor (ECF subfamily)
VEPGTAGAWLLKVTRNACFDALRSRRSRGRLFQDGLDEEAAAAPERDGRPDEALAAWDVRRHLRRALGALDDPYRAIAILREVEGRSYQEIAEAMDMPLNTVKTYLHRARRKLRELMREVRCYAPSA